MADIIYLIAIGFVALVVVSMCGFGSNLINYAIVTVVFCSICGLIGAKCGASRRRERAGFWLGVLIGPVGCILALFLPSVDLPPADSRLYKGRPHTVNTCSMCGKFVAARVGNCPDCGSAL